MEEWRRTRTLPEHLGAPVPPRAADAQSRDLAREVAIEGHALDPSRDAANHVDLELRVHRWGGGTGQEDLLSVMATPCTKHASC